MVSEEVEMPTYMWRNQGEMQTCMGSEPEETQVHMAVAQGTAAD